jgi:tRNA dimethylallyltransferase
VTQKARGPWPLVVAVVGPTASGKSAVALEVAQRLGAEIINADAFQLYRGMDIGTAKPGAIERAQVRHHLLDVLEPGDEASVADYQSLGRAALVDLRDRDVPAVVVGGSGLYVRALLDDLRFPGSDPGLRARWEAELERMGPAGLHAELARRDPAAARAILPTNSRRIVRALEVIDLTGKPFPALLPVSGPPCVPHVSIGLQWDRPALDARIDRRVLDMMAAGFEDEVRGLLIRGLREARTARRALGYPQIIDLLDGRIGRQEAIDAIAAATRAFARRQERWFRRDPRSTWLPGPAAASSTAAEIVSVIRGSGK